MEGSYFVFESLVLNVDDSIFVELVIERLLSPKQPKLPR